MKILYAIQGTGNGHISRARDIIPLLQKKGELDILVSGTEADVDTGYPVKYNFKGLSFVFGKNGGIDLVSTYKKANLKRFYKEVKNLPVEKYDIIINDFEPVSAWACRLKHKECVGLSHQCAVLNKKSPVPEKKDRIGRSVLKNYAPVTYKFGFHFQSYDTNISTPVIRAEIRNADNRDLGHYTVYLPAYEDKKIIRVLEQMKNVEWQVFSKHSKKSYRKKNVLVTSINNKSFIKSLVTCTGVLCGAGFETPAEALFLKKKLLVIPMKGQYEQQCNAAALSKMNVPVLKKFTSDNVVKIADWILKDGHVNVQYPNMTSALIDDIFNRYHIAQQTILAPVVPGNQNSKIRQVIPGGLLHQITG